MRTVHKFKLAINNDVQVVDCRVGAKFLTAEMQDGDLCLWIEHETSQPVQAKEFRVYGTGHPIQGFSQQDWRATVMAPPFVWHVYEVL